jgi:AcrR family transcriptional regulator
MGRRSTHTGGELREMILEAARALIESGGLSGLSAREIAKRIGYSPGTIYNVFDNLDDVILNVEARLLSGLSDRLAAVPTGQDPMRYLLDLSHAYLQFTHDNPKLWNLLFEHHLPAGTEVPDWYREKLDGLMAWLEGALKPLIPRADEATLKRQARVLWAGVHGITSLSTADKLCNVTTDSAVPLVDDLVRTFVAGLQAPQILAKCA